MNKDSPRLDVMLSRAKASNCKLLAVLIDPDKPGKDLGQFARSAEENGVDILLVGGSLVMLDALDDCINVIRKNCSLPIYLFPSGPSHIKAEADGILFLSLISSRNPDLLIGKHVEAAPLLAQTDLHVISTGYMLIDSGNVTTAHYMSQSNPIPHDKPEIAQATALAGQYLGMSMIYMDGGSGALRSVSPEMISTVSRSISIPLVIGGGISNVEDAARACKAGADMIVVGNALESNPEILQDLSIAVHSMNITQ